MTDWSRRRVLVALGAAALSPLVARAATGNASGFRIRTITAGITPRDASDFGAVERALEFLKRARNAYAAEGHEIQTVRVSTPPIAAWLPAWQEESSLSALARLEDRVTVDGAAFSVGPVLTTDAAPAGFASWAADFVQATKSTQFSVWTASQAGGVHHGTARAAAEAVAAIARVTPGGEGNFRFAATAFIPAGTPFFPAGWHEGEPAFALGLESPLLLLSAFEGAQDIATGKAALRARLETALVPLERLAEGLAHDTGWRYRGLDASPAPAADASIGAAIEALTGVPFGESPTLAACAAITDVLKSLSVRTCGYNGLMLPVLEDPVLARRATEGRFGVSELLLYSSACGTGLDVVPLPGAIPVADLAATIVDVAALATRYRKPLSARLMPLPGKSVGDVVKFDNPHLVEARVMAPG